MIRFIKGVFHPGINGSVVVETNSGIGFIVNVPANSPLYKNMEGEEVKVYTLMIVKEDDISLYGFTEKESLSLFQQLITVNGVGPKAGMSIMSILPPNQLRIAIAGGDVKTISTANGVGKKTAERLILELKDKMGITGQEETAFYDVSDDIGDSRSEAVSALMSLGYTKNEAASAIGKVKETDLTSEEYIKKALKNLL